jgi:hypothetical protein
VSCTCNATGLTLVLHAARQGGVRIPAGAVKTA